MENTVPTSAFRLLPPDRPTGAARFLLKPFARLAEKLFGLDCLQKRYEALPPGDSQALPGRALAALNITYSATGVNIDDIPRQGPVIIVANHPFGAVEGMIFMDLLRRVRPDVRLMANRMLGRIPDLGEMIIGIDPFGGLTARKRNVASVREAINWVTGGGMLVVFPAGEVSSFNIRRCMVTDPPWHDHLARIIRKSKAPVVPVYFPGRNPLLFQLAGLVHPLLRTALLPRQLLNKKGRNITLRIGKTISFRKLQQFDSAENLIAYVRWRTYFLSCHDQPDDSMETAAQLCDQPPVISALNPERLAKELDGLPEESLLLESGEFTVYIADAGQIPQTLREIGRLREVTFRDVGEGTGKPIDLSMYDQYYLHLFIWHRENREIVGGYRIGQTDRILPELGRRGLYCSTLFKINQELLDRISPALEMGRSFVRAEYQKSYAPLLLLWKGIGHYIARNPQYRYLFGPVSISRDYRDSSRRLIASSLMQNYYLDTLEGLVQPKLPVNIRPLKIKGEADSSLTADLDEISELVAELELDRKGVPVLIRHYLNLGGKLLAFNLDQHFSNVIDGLLLVDLCETEDKLLLRYMGKEGAARFSSYQAGVWLRSGGSSSSFRVRRHS